MTLANIVNLLCKYTLTSATAMDKARTIYEWMTKNITYDMERKLAIDDGIDNGIPRDPEYTLQCKKGVCSDMSLLYVELAKKLGLKAQYAHVSVDYKGIKVAHACAIIDVPEGQVQVDVAYQVFGTKHKVFEIINPHIQNKYAPIIPRRKGIIRRILVACTLLAGIISYFTGEFGSSPKNEKITLLESGTGSKFVSQNGSLSFTYDNQAETALKEYVFFAEAKEGQLRDNILLDKYLAIDTNKDCTISLEEAISAKNTARDDYFGKTQY